MTVQQYIERLEQILGIELLLKKQINALSIIKIEYIVEKNPVGEECRCTYDLPELWDEYALKLRKCIYFLDRYCDGILRELDLRSALLHTGDVSIPAGTDLEKAIFNFDALILSVSTIMEYEERDYLSANLKRTKINNIYPKKDEIGLYWQVNLLRNRIVHHTGGRYINAEECQRFLDFSSNVRMVNKVNGNISMRCTQIDVYKDKVQEVLPIAIAIARKTEKNIFDVLFPSRSGKGHGRKHPVIIVPNEDIYFDHVDSGISMIVQIQDFVRKINQAFFREFYYKISKKETLQELCIELCDNNQVYRYPIKSVFDAE